MKKLGFLLSAIFGLLIVAAIIAPSFISTDSFKAEITQKVESATGRRLTIGGKLGITLFPTASLTAEQVTLSNPPGFDDKVPFLTLSVLKVDVELLPLLSKKILIKQFVLQEPSINLHVAKSGANNWTVTTTKPEAPAMPPVPKEKTPADKPDKLPDNIMLSNFNLKQGTLLYTNDMSNSRTEIKNLDATMTISSSAAAVMIESSGEWNGKAIRMKTGLGTLQSLLFEKKTDFNVNLDSELFSVALNGNYNNGAITGKSTLKSPSIKSLVGWLNPKGKPLDTPAKLAFLSESELRCGNSYCNLPDIHLVLDQFEARGIIKLNLAGAKPVVDIDLKTEKLDFNPFLTAPKQAGLGNGFLVSDAFAQAGERWSSAPIDVSGLQAVNANVSIRTDIILFQKIAIGKTALTARLQDGKLAANIPNAAMYSGTGTIAMTIDSNANPPVFDNHLLFKSIQLEPLLKDMSDMDRITGIADMQVNISGRGHSEKDIVSSLSGDGQVKLTDGTIKRVNLLQMLNNVQSAFADANNNAQVTNFSQAAASFTIAQGVVTNHDLLLQLKDMNVNGDGTVNLPAYVMNYRLTPKIIRTVQDTTTGATTTKEGLAVPVIIEGSLDAPKFRPDLAAAVQDALQDPKKLKEQLKNSRETIKEQLKNPKDAVKNLKGLLGR